MKDKLCTITILPAEQKLTALPGSSLYTLLLVEGLVSADDPGSDRVRLERGILSPADDPAREAEAFSPAELAEGWVLASERRIMGDAEITLPEHVVGNYMPARPLTGGFGVALDVGDATISAGLINMHNMLIPTLAACSNSAQELGLEMSDRIAAAKRDPAVAQKMAALLKDDVARLVGKLTERAGINSAEITAVTMAGGHPLQHLLLTGELAGDDDLGRVTAKTAGELEWELFIDDTEIYLLPAVSTDLGADTVGAILAADLLHKKDNDNLTMLIDIDMTCDIILAGLGRIVACSVPSAALEGGGISCGIPPVPGAVTEVIIDDESIDVQTVRGSRAQGLSGAGLVSAVYALLSQGMIDGDGRLTIPEELPDALRERLRGTAAGREFVIVPADEEYARDITINQDDILRLQIVKASIRAACSAVLAAFDANDNDLGEVLVSESYCANMRPEPLLALGLLPETARGRVVTIGNASWQGAYLALTDRKLLEETEELAALVECLDLNADAVYTKEFLQSMHFH